MTDTPSVEAFVAPERGPHILRSKEDAARFVEEIMRLTPPDDPQLALLYAIAPGGMNKHGRPNHEFGVGFDSSRGRCSLSYSGPEPAGTWFSLDQSESESDVTEYAYFGEPAERPANSSITTADTVEAICEFLATEGKRPTKVNWQLKPDPVA
ncbi:MULTISPECIES: Imm1 family immunity protein [unclassified Crossiella]|uniref:Imm1 family immunity protein n=1 Tax=unclassified Crossiella TaxID=2620835 RepID=UPI001FFFDEC7|nr:MULTISPECIES: Imm1 family immunity protein [unclassified Crossiella]MCK2237740.1 Imm1 family immunity protein [Crossiella sp. S99.2]MCK2255026.1 Imm1 family immunity protein [Crossiella sp. S99.1]